MSPSAINAPSALRVAVLDADAGRIQCYRRTLIGATHVSPFEGPERLLAAASDGHYQVVVVDGAACGQAGPADVARRLRKAAPDLALMLVHAPGEACDAAAFDALVARPIDELALAQIWRCLAQTVLAREQLAAVRQDLYLAKRVGAIAHWWCNPVSGETQWCAAFRELLGLSRPGGSAEAIWERVHPEDRERLRTLLHGLADAPREVSVVYRVVHPTLGIRQLRQESLPVIGADGVLRIASAVQEATDGEGVQDTIHKLAYFDPLTDLPNRSFLNEYLRSVVLQARRYNRTAAILHVDLDSFKRINDTLGHGAGDRLLQEVAVRLQGCVRDSDCVAREQGGELWATGANPDAVTRFAADEFILVLSEVASTGDPERVAERILARLKDPVELDDREITVGASIGIAVYPDDAADEDALLRNAALAMQSAKRRGRNNHKRFSQALVANGVDRLSMEAKLRQALESGGLSLHYQPKVEATSRRLSGAEALLRWEHPDLGMVPPSEFIPIAEEAGLILPLGEWVIAEVCTQLASWRSQGLAIVPVSINVSAQQLHDHGLVRKVCRELERVGVPPHSLEFEITESVLMEDTGSGAERLRELQAMGSMVSMDDFGTGYSSLSYLKRLPIDVVKIDRSFVRDILGEEDDQAILRAIITMAHQLRLRIVAEGVESDAQMRLLTEMDCDLIQGFVVSRPLPAEEFARRFLASVQRLAS